MSVLSEKIDLYLFDKNHETSPVDIVTLIALQEPLEQYQTVTGHLVAMDFAKRCIILKYPPTGTVLECYYNDTIEAERFENCKELIQVTGDVTYQSDKETPKKITNVDDIQILDLTGFTLKLLPFDNSTELVFEPPLILTQELTACKQYVTIENTDLGIDVIAQTRDELWEELTAEMQMLWTTCAKEDDSKLGKLFQIQKKNLLARIKEVK